MGELMTPEFTRVVPALYRCGDCNGLSRYMPVIVEVSTWNSDFETWVSHQSVVCYDCFDAAMSAGDPVDYEDSDLDIDDGMES